MGAAGAQGSGAEKRPDFDNISNSQISQAIDEWIHSKRDRLILKLRLIEGLTYQQTSDFLYDEHGIELSVRQIKNIVYKSEVKLFKHL